MKIDDFCSIWMTSAQSENQSRNGNRSLSGSGKYPTIEGGTKTFHESPLHHPIVLALERIEFICNVCRGKQLGKMLVSAVTLKRNVF